MWYLRSLVTDRLVVVTSAREFHELYDSGNYIFLRYI